MWQEEAALRLEAHRIEELVEEAQGERKLAPLCWLGTSQSPSELVGQRLALLQSEATEAILPLRAWSHATEVEEEGLLKLT